MRASKKDGEKTQEPDHVCDLCDLVSKPWVYFATMLEAYYLSLLL